MKLMKRIVAAYRRWRDNPLAARKGGRMYPTSPALYVEYWYKKPNTPTQKEKGEL